ncbi:hypothetical protein [Nitrobacter hamburgensis]|uniref:hypothetical protein n=1 Tax=Nitrobacter hamburgensis TaxID=912 RepID=UPI0018DB2FA4|nr:hypothetical protein [Nitrobacter hamburgensis]
MVGDVGTAGWIVMAAKLQSFGAGSYGIAAMVRVFHASDRDCADGEGIPFSFYSITVA